MSGFIFVQGLVAENELERGDITARWGLFLIRGGYMVLVTQNKSTWMQPGATEVYLFGEGLGVSRFLNKRNPALKELCDDLAWELPPLESEE
jgi:hypothetical protein